MKSIIQKKLLESLSFDSHGILELSPRFGKSRLAIEILKKKDFNKVLWVTPNAQLRDKDIPEEFKKWEAESLLKKVEIICYNSLDRIKGNYDKVILDEVQFITPRNTQNLLSKELNTRSILGLTGTLPKSPEKVNILDMLRLRSIAKINITEAVNKDLIADYSIKVIYVPLEGVEKTFKAGTKEKPFLTTELRNYEYLTSLINDFKDRGLSIPKHLALRRMKFIYNLESKLKVAKRLFQSLESRTLLFAPSIKAAESISNNTFHSLTNKKDLENFLDGKIKKLACVNAGGVGFTFKGVQNFIISQVNSNSTGLTTQKIARALVKQDNYKANIFIIVAKGTVDEEWLNKSLKDFDPNKVKYYNAKDFVI